MPKSTITESRTPAILPTQIRKLLTHLLTIISQIPIIILQHNSDGGAAHCPGYFVSERCTACLRVTLHHAIILRHAALHGTVLHFTTHTRNRCMTTTSTVRTSSPPPPPPAPVLAPNIQLQLLARSAFPCTSRNLMKFQVSVPCP